MAKSKLENKNPPRRTTIRGQDHLLAYITPEEAQLLMDNGGTGEAGPMGIPSYPEPGGVGGSSGGSTGGGGNKDGGDPRGESSMSGGAGAFGESGRGGTTGVGGGSSKSAAEKATQAALEAALSNEVGDYGISDIALGMSPGALGGIIGSSHQTAPSTGRGFDVNLQKARTAIHTELQKGWVDEAIEEAYQKGLPMKGFVSAPPGYPGVFSSFSTEQSMPAGLLSAAFGVLGLPTTGWVTTGWGEGVTGEGPQGDGAGPIIVPAQTNPVTGQQNQCPEGYVFDADLQACRVSAGLPGGSGTVPDTGPYQPGTYARMGLLDVAPTGLEQFASTYGTGFGTAPDYEAANLRYRKQAGTTPQIFQDPYNLPGYTLLS